MNIINCLNPSTMAMFDGQVPTLTGLDGDRWASQLFTIQSSNGETDIVFDFQNNQDFDTVLTIEIVMFNCPQWGIGVQNIGLLDEGDFIISDTNPSVSSCDSLVRVCLPALSQSPVLVLKFLLTPGSTWVHLAEVTFFSGSSVTCSPDTILTMQTSSPSPPLETTTPITSKFG